jgi:tripartite-type tricarboxylate transporter receptor subunit TctC
MWCCSNRPTARAERASAAEEDSVRNTHFIAGWAAAAVLLFAGPTLAQSYPSKPIRIVAPYAPGGAVDLMARYLCERFPESLGQPCVVENRTGAGGIIGIDLVAKSEPDGYTLAMVPNNLAIIPSLYAKVPYDTLVDLAPIALVSDTPVMIGAHPSVPAKSLQDLVAHSKEQNGKVNFTSCGPATPQHLAGEILAAQGGFRWTHIPYKGCGAALADVLSGTVPVFISTVAHFMPQIKAGKLRGFAVLGPKRTPFAPDTPTVAESGFPGFQAEVWFGLIAPGKTPTGIVARLNAEVNKALAVPDLREKLLAGFYEPLGGTQERFAAAIRADMARFGKVIRELGIKAD